MLNLRSFFLVLVLGCIIGVIFFAPPVKRSSYKEIVRNNSETKNVVENELLLSDSYNQLPNDDSQLIELEEKILASLKTEEKLTEHLDPPTSELLNQQASVSATNIDRFVNTGWPSITRTVVYYDQQGANAKEHTINFIPKFPNSLVGWREFDFEEDKDEFSNDKLSIDQVDSSFENLKKSNLKLKEKLLVAKLLNSVGANKIEKIEPAKEDLATSNKSNNIDNNSLIQNKTTTNQDLVYMSIIGDSELLRVGPGFQYTAITLANYNETLILEEISNNWCRVVTEDGLRAWIPKNSLKLLDIEAEG